MANPHKGEVALGDHTLVLSINAICEIEEAFGLPIKKIGERLSGEETKLTDVRTIVWAGLQEKHEGLTEKDAGRIIGEAGIEAAVEAIGKAFAAAFPQGEARGTSRPRKAGG